LQKIIDAKETGIKEARLTFIVWGRAYQKMALGKTDPAEWFDISESGNLLMGAAGRAIGL
jgi:spermidine/putrescine-binding protein